MIEIEPPSIETAEEWINLILVAGVALTLAIVLLIDCVLSLFGVHRQ